MSSKDIDGASTAQELKERHKKRERKSILKTLKCWLENMKGSRASYEEKEIIEGLCCCSRRQKHSQWNKPYPCQDGHFYVLILKPRGMILLTGQNCLLTERGTLQILSSDFYFPKTNNKWHFSEEFYMQKLRHEEGIQRNWLIYSMEADVNFCFCYKFYGSMTGNQ
jgi:hypothetical protein